MGAIDNPTEMIDSGDRWNGADYVTDDSFSVPFNSTGLGAISKTGNTVLGVRSQPDVLDSGLPNNNTNTLFRLYAPEDATYPPYLEVTYTDTPTTTDTNFLIMF